MHFFCPECGTRNEVLEGPTPPTGQATSCVKCSFVFTFKPAEVKPPEKSPEEPAAPVPSVADPEVKEKSDREETESEIHAMGAVSKAAGDDVDETWDLPRYETAPDRHVDSSVLSRVKCVRLPYFGTGKSGEEFRFRDLFYALAVPLDLRKVLLVGAFEFVGILCFVLLAYVGASSRSTVGSIIGLVTGGLVFWSLTILACAVTTQLANLEMQHGHRLRLAEAVQFVISRAVAVLFTPILFLLVLVLLVAVIAGISLLGRIPYVGPPIYGLAFGATLLVSFCAVATFFLMMLTVFSYIPALAREGLNARSVVRRMLLLIRRFPGTFLLNVLVACLVSVFLLLMLQGMFGLAVGLIGWLGRDLMGPNFSSTLLAVPGGLFVPVIFMLPESLQAGILPAADQGWQFSTGGWLMGFSLLSFVSLLMAFVLVYFQAAGVVNYHLLVRKEEEL